MPTIKIKVQDKIATNLTPNQKIVCGNEDYKVEFEFDNQWNNAEAKTALFIYNGGAIVEPFLGNVCKVPILQNTELLTVGVKTDDGLLYTSTGAKVFCLYSASDLANVEIPAPSKDVYDQIIELINNKIIGENLPYEELPLMDGIAQSGESSRYARGDHRHPTDENLKAIAENAEKIAQSAQENLNLSMAQKVDKVPIANQLLGTDAEGNPTSYSLDSVGTKVLVNGEKVTEFDADTKLDKTTATAPSYQLYGTGYSMTDTKMYYAFPDATGANWLAMYGEGGVLAVGTPKKDTHAVNKKYVDEAVANACGGSGLTEAEVDAKINAAIGGIENGTY